jgi:hypothetical protein
MTRPAGLNSRRWADFTRVLWDGPWRGAPCYFCGHAIIRGLGEVQHQVSPHVAPALAWNTANLKPVHGSGRRRCPQCLIGCNAVAASNHAPRGPGGLPVPWDQPFITAKSEQAAAKIARGEVRGPARRISRDSADTARRVYASAGRPW